MSKMYRRALPALLALSVAAAAYGQEKPGTSAVVARASVGSYDALTRFVVDLGLPPASLTGSKEALEGLAYMGPGTLATGKPFGVSVIAGDPHKLFPIEDSVVISFPVLPAKISVSELTAHGGTVLEGTTDILKIDAVTARRTADYLHFKDTPMAFGLAAVNDGLFAADFKDASRLFVVSADFAAFRKVAPNAYQELAKQITALPRMIGISTPDDAKPVASVLDKMDQFSLALSQDETSFHLQTLLSPSPLPAKAKEAPRPAFPAGTVVRIHLVYPTPESAAYLEKQLAALSEDNFDFGMPPVYHQRAKDMVLKLASLNTRTEAVSVGFAMKGKEPVVYVVEQFNTDVDAAKELLDMANEAAGLAAEGAGEKVNVQSATYSVGNQKVQRLTLSPEAAAAAGGAPGASEKLVIDEIQTGRTLFLAISANADGKYVADVAAAGMDGKSTALCAGAVDLSAALMAASDAGVMAGVTPEQLQKFKTGWTGLSVKWTVQASDRNLTTDVQIPKQVVRDLVKMSLTPAPAAPQPTQGLP